MNPKKHIIGSASFRVAMLLWALICFSCQEEEPSPSLVNFSTSLQTVVEGGTASVGILLDKKASHDGFVVLMLETNAVYGRHYSVDPVTDNNVLTLPIEKGQKSVEFSVRALNNELFDDVKIVIFKLISASEGFQLGPVISYTITIRDDEEPSLAGFSTSEGAVSENESDGIIVDIGLSSPAAGTGTITVSFVEGVVYGTSFTTDPVAHNNSITLVATPNSTHTSFKVFPVVNSLCSDFHLGFTISSVSGVVKANEFLNYNLTIKDTDASIVSFAEEAGSVTENSLSGIAVHLNFSRPAPTDAILYISTLHDVSNPYFTTNPEMIADDYGFFYVPVAIQKNAMGAEFTVLPLNNEVTSDYPKLIFNCLSTVPCMVGNGSYTLTIEDDD